MPLPRVINPFNIPGPQPDGPHAAAQGMAFSTQNKSLYYNACGSALNMEWPSVAADIYGGGIAIYNTPAADISTPQVWTAFFLSGHDLLIPWYFTPGFDKIIAVATVFTNHDYKVSMRLVSDVLIDPVAGTVGKNSYPTHVSAPVSGLFCERLTARGKFRQTTMTMELPSPTLPANRRIALLPEAQITVPSGPLASLSCETLIYLKSLVLYDALEGAVWS